MERPTKTKATISKVKNLTPDVKHFELELETPFKFKAGQFVNLSFEHEGKKILRPYSISSHPQEEGNKKIDLCIKLVEDGKFTPILWDKQEGDEIEVMGALGLFTLEKSQKEKLVFIATGTGIAPFRSMVKDLIAEESEKEITLIFGVRHEKHHCYEEEFIELQKLSPNFKYIPVVSRPEDSWNGRIGHVQQNLDSVDPINSDVFICGLPQMVDSTIFELEKKGMLKENIFYEKY